MTCALLTLMSAEEVAADPARWHKHRRAGVGASEIAGVLGLRSAFRGPVATWWAKVSPDPAGDEDDRFGLGLFLEPYVAGLLEARYPHLTLARGGLYASSRWPLMLATPDYLATTPDGVTFPIQVKSVATWVSEDPAHCWGTPPDGAVPPHYDAQCIQEAAVTDAPVCWLAALNRMTGELRVYEVLIDEIAGHDQWVMARAIEEFMGLVEARTPPPPDGRPDTTDALRAMYAAADGGTVRIPRRLAHRLRAAQAAKSAADARYAEAQNEVRARLGTATTAVTRGGDVVAVRSVYTEQRVNLRRLRRRAPRTAQRHTEPRQIDKLLVKAARNPEE